ncbi:MAG: histidine kinase [Gemmatimonadota bacterium]
MSRRVVWLQLLIGWLPVWALFTVLILAAHSDVSTHEALLLALRLIIAAAALGVGAQRIIERHPWPKRVRARFVWLHLIVAVSYAVLLVAFNSLLESAMRGAVVINTGPSFTAFLLLGVWVYVMIAGVSYATRATERAAHAEANAAKAQLAALRSQLHPHFLFNALHSVVHLIPREPKRAADAAEQLAALLRVTIEEDRDLVPAADELSFVDRYLDLERVRFGDRLRVRVNVSGEALAAEIPLFALQTLVENAVRHGAAPRIEATEIIIVGTTGDGKATFTVQDTGGGASADTLAQSDGTGLARLRERLVVLYGRDGRLVIVTEAQSGFCATLTVPYAGNGS